MSLTKKNRPSQRASAARERARQAAAQRASVARERARQAAEQIGPLAKSAARERARQAAEQIGPLAKSAQATAAQGMHIAREWSAPRIEQASQSVQRTVAPKVSAALEATAQRIEPAPEKLRDLSRRAQRRAAKAGQDTGRRRAMIIAGVVALFAAALGAVSAVAVRRSAGSKESATGGNPGSEPGTQPLGDAESGVNGQVPTPTSSS